MTDVIRVLRVLEYVGEREAVERHLRSVLYGEKVLPKYSIRAVTVGVVPDIFNQPTPTATD